MCPKNHLCRGILSSYIFTISSTDGMIQFCHLKFFWYSSSGGMYAERRFLFQNWFNTVSKYRSSHSEVFFKKGVLKICSKFTGQHPFRRVVSIKLLCNFIKIALRHMCSPANLLHIFRTPFLKNTSGRLLLQVFCTFVSIKHSILYAIVLIVKM